MKGFHQHTHLLVNVLLYPICSECLFLGGEYHSVCFLLQKLFMFRSVICTRDIFNVAISLSIVLVFFLKFIFFLKTAADFYTKVNSPSTFAHLISLSSHSSTYLPRFYTSLPTPSTILNKPRPPSFLGTLL